MNPPQIASTPQDSRDPFQPLDDAFLSEFDDAALEHALRTVSWRPKDVSQFLRSVAAR
jgi:hypothetical protein